MPDESKYSYYAGDKKVELELVEDAVAVSFSDNIPERRLEELRTGEEPIDVLSRSPALVERNVLVHHTGPSARGPARVAAFTARVSRGDTVDYATNVFRHPETGLYMVPLDEIVVRFKPGVTQEQMDALHAANDVEVLEQKMYAHNQCLLRVRNPTTERVFAVANAYHESGLTEWAAPNFVREKQKRFQAFQWHLDNRGVNGPTNQGPGLAEEDVHANEAWAITQGSGNIIIAILDEGVDTLNAGLRNNIAPGGRNFDDPSIPDNPNPTDDNAHGTACAGVAAGAGGRISGIAPGCKILPIKMLEADENRTADAIHYAAQRAQVLSNSWGYGAASPPVDQAILDVTANGREGKGSVVVFAVGNENQAIAAGDQSRVERVIAIGASTNVGSRSGYSNIGESNESPPAQKRISALASSDGTSANRPFWQSQLTGPPSTGPFEEDNSTENIYTTDIHDNPGYNPPKPSFAPSIPEPAPVAADDDYTALFGGTSSACPLAAGICALMLSVNADLTRAQVKYILESTADKIGTGQPRTGVPLSTSIPPGKAAGYNQHTGHDPAFGFGRVNAERAVKVARGDALPQVVRPEAGDPALQDAIPVTLKRQPGTNHFVCDETIILVDARRDADQLNEADKIYVRGGPGGFLRATYQPAGGGPAMTDEVTVQGEPT